MKINIVDVNNEKDEYKNLWNMSKSELIAIIKDSDNVISKLTEGK